MRDVARSRAPAHDFLSFARLAAASTAPTPLAFRFDGARYVGHPGDTLASALLADGVGLMGRSFKYHRAARRRRPRAPPSPTRS